MVTQSPKIIDAWFQSKTLHLNQFFAGKEQKFYERGTMKMIKRCQKLIDQNGKYTIK